MPSPAPVEKAAVFAKSALIVSAGLLLVGAIPNASRLLARSTEDVTQQDAAQPRVKTGTELIAYFVASSTCGASKHPELPIALSRIRADLAASAKARNIRFVTVGVSLDHTPEAGLAFLKPFGPFDEVMAGGSWVATGAVHLLIREHPGPLSLPQLVIIERDIVAEQSEIKAGKDRVIARHLGFAEILKLAGMKPPTEP